MGALATMLTGQQAAATPSIPQAPSTANAAMTALGVDPALSQMLDDRRRAHSELSQTALGTLDDIDTQRQETMAEPMTRPEVPDLPEAPEPPPTRMPANGMRVYAQFLPVLAMLGGALVNRDATAALRTGASAMRAARANDQQNLELQHQHWEDQMTRLTTDRQSMLEQYQAALSDANLNLNQRMAILDALAAQENNIQLRTRVSMGDLEGIGQMINTQMQAVTAIRTQLRQDAEANSRIAARAAGGRAGQLAGAEQRGRIVMSLPNVIANLAAMEQIESATIPEGSDTGTNPYDRNATAAWLSGIPALGDSIERAMTQNDPQYQSYDNAVASLEQSFIPMFAGAATTESEARRYVRANAPRVGDTWQRIIEKRQNLQRLANQAAIIIGQPPPYPEAGYLDPRQAQALTPPADTGSSGVPPPADLAMPGEMEDGYRYVGPPSDDPADRANPGNWELVE